MSGLLFGLAILAAILRMFIRGHFSQRIQIDDGLLLLACICLIGETILLYKAIPYIYFAQSLTATNGAGESLAVIVEKIERFQKEFKAFLVVTWAMIFLVKFSFLFFFRRIIDRLTNIIFYWKVVIVINVMIFGFAVSDGFIVCLKSDLSAGE